MIYIGDTVMVIAGKDKGKSGEVKKVLREKNRIMVKGVNMIIKHMKKTKEAPGQRVKLEASMDISNVALVCPKTNKPTRVAIKFTETGEKYRVAKVSGEVIPHRFKKS